MASQDIKKEGNLKKKSRYLGLWRKRWTVLTPADNKSFVSTYKKAKVYNKPTEHIRIDNDTDIEIFIDKNDVHELLFFIQNKKDKERFLFRAKSKRDRDAWITCLTNANKKKDKQFLRNIINGDDDNKVEEERIKTEQVLDAPLPLQNKLIDSNINTQNNASKIDNIEDISTSNKILIDDQDKQEIETEVKEEENVVIQIERETVKVQQVVNENGNIQVVQNDNENKEPEKQQHAEEEIVLKQDIKHEIEENKQEVEVELEAENARNNAQKTESNDVAIDENIDENVDENVIVNVKQESEQKQAVQGLVEVKLIKPETENQQEDKKSQIEEVVDDNQNENENENKNENDKKQSVKPEENQPKQDEPKSQEVNQEKPKDDDKKSQIEEVKIVDVNQNENENENKESVKQEDESKLKKSEPEAPKQEQLQPKEEEIAKPEQPQIVELEQKEQELPNQQPNEQPKEDVKPEPKEEIKESESEAPKQDEPQSQPPKKHQNEPSTVVESEPQPQIEAESNQNTTQNIENIENIQNEDIKQEIDDTFPPAAELDLKNSSQFKNSDPEETASISSYRSDDGDAVFSNRWLFGTNDTNDESGDTPAPTNTTTIDTTQMQYASIVLIGNNNTSDKTLLFNHLSDTDIDAKTTENNENIHIREVVFMTSDSDIDEKKQDNNNIVCALMNTNNDIQQTINNISMSDIALIVINIDTLDDTLQQLKGFITILNTYGIGQERCICCLNDIIDREQYEKCVGKCRDIVGNMIFIPVSCNNGDNIYTMRESGGLSWYDNGMTVVDAIKSIKFKLDEKINVGFVMVVDKVEVREDKDRCMVMGKIAQGRIYKGDTCKLANFKGGDSDGDDVSVVEIQRYGQDMESGEYGDYVSMVVSGGGVLNGDVLYNDGVEEKLNVGVCKSVTALVVMVGDGSDKLEVKFEGMICIGGNSVLCELSEINWKGDEKNEGEVVFMFKEEIVATTFKECESLGRFVVIDEDKVVLVGTIESVVVVVNE